VRYGIGLIASVPFGLPPSRTSAESRGGVRLIASVPLSPPLSPQQQLEQLSQLPKAKQRLVSEVLDSLIAQNSR